MDTLTGMRTYVTVVKTGSFTAAAERLGYSTALTSKYVAQLEAHLGARLLNRTTRRLHVTETGQLYYERCLRLLDDFDGLEAEIRQQEQTPRGNLSMTAPISFGERYLTPALAEFMGLYPELSVELELTDQFVNILAQGLDLAIRIGQLQDSSLIARQLNQTPMICAASPAYLQIHGQPQQPQELARHICLIDTKWSTPDLWHFQHGEQSLQVRISSRFRVNNALAIREMMLAGAGIGICPGFLLTDDLQTGRLLPLLTDYRMQPLGIYAVYPPHRFQPAKVRVFLDFLARRFRQQV